MKSRKSRNTAKSPQIYAGRFAPSPTGPLHLGSLICALASFLDARHNSGSWVLRMEDLDPPREIPGSAQSILNSLQAHGLGWDGEVLWQSQRHEAYAVAIQKLLDTGYAFRCDCSRAQLATQGAVYPGHCRSHTPAADVASAIRVKVRRECPIAIADRLQLPLDQDLQSEVGDFVVQRKDGLYAYQLAVVIDDEYQGINQVLRGSDLYDSTPRQVYLQEVLDLPTPDYAHIPVITNPAGQKLSKQTHAVALNNSDALQNLRLALRFLGQAVHAEANNTDRLLRDAIDSWQLQSVPARAGIPETALY
jgi:glutamyl-Q tRNA(Asp) synthetase